jgi:hypothetical protein
MKRILQKLTLCLTTALWLASSPVAMAAPKHTGIEGQSFLYISYGNPIQVAPGVWIGIPSVQLPVATSFKVLSAHNRREVAQVTTDANGHYSLTLPPGKYVLVPDPLIENPFFYCPAATAPIEVSVKAKQFTRANIFYFRTGFCIFTGTPVQLGDNQWTAEGD